MELIETVGARLVLLGQREYVAAMAEANKSMDQLATGAKTVATSSTAMTEATVRNQAAQRELADSMRTAVAAQREYNSALEASVRADAEAAAGSTETTRANQAEARSRLEAADAARAAALTEVKASQESAAAAATAASEVQAAEERKVAASEAGSKSMKAAALGVVAVAGVVAGAAVKMAADFQSATNRLVTSAGESLSNLDMVRNGILAMASQVGYSSDELAAAMYKVESGGRHGAEGLQVLQAAAQGAKSENADLTLVADAVTSALQDYHLAGTDAADVTSKLVAATSQGKMTFEELSGSMSAILPIASQNHIALSEILGDLASMTVHGMSAQQASQNLADAIRHMQQPTMVQRKELAALGVNATELSDKLGERGLAGTIQVIAHAIQNQMGPGTTGVVLNLKNALNGLPPAVRELGQKVLDGTITTKGFSAALAGLDPITAAQARSFSTLAGTMHGIGTSAKSGAEVYQTYGGAMARAMGDASGLNVALMLTGENSDITSGAIGVISKATADAAGNVQGWDEIQSTFNQKLDEAGAGIGALAIQIGTVLLPPLTVLLGALADGVTWLTQHKDVAMVLAAVLGGLLVGGLILATAALWGMVAPLLIIDGALSPLAIVIGVVVLAVAALAAGAYLIITNWGAITGFFSGLWSTITSGASAAWEWIKSASASAAASIGAFFQPAVNAVVAGWNWIRDIAVGVWNWIVSIVMIAVNAIVGFFQPAVDAISAHWDEVEQITTFIWDFILGFFRMTWNLIVAVFEIAFAILSPIVEFAWGLIVGLTQNLWNSVVIYFQILWPIITDVFNFALSVIKTILDLAWNIIMGAIHFTWGLIVMVLQGAWDTIVMIFNVARDLVVGILVVLLDILTGNWSRAWTDIKDFAGRIWDDITTGITTWATDLWHNVVAIWDNFWTDTKNVFTSLWEDLKGIFRDGANIVIDVINGFLDIVNKVAGAIGFSINLHIDHVGTFAEGGVLPVRLMASGGPLDFGQVGSGFVTNGPRAIVGEGNPAYPEYVVPTDPRYRGRAMGLFADLAGQLGLAAGGQIPAMADGGILGAIWSGISAVGQGFSTAFNWVGAAISNGIRSVIESVWPQLPVPENSFAGLVPATLNNWRDKALEWITGKYNAYEATLAATAPPGSGPVVAQVQAAANAFGWGSGPEWDAIGWIVSHESGWNPNAQNPSSTAYGLFQFLDGTWGTVGGSKTSNPGQQAVYGMRYIQQRYGDPLGAKSFWQSHGYYARGGVLPPTSVAVHLPARAGGGPVDAGMPYMVGERGPELFVPDSTGSVVSNAGMGGLGATHVTVQAGAVVIHEARDPDAVYAAVKQGIADAVARR